jgi:hypothetical protein
MSRAGVRATLGVLLVLSLGGCSDDSPVGRQVGVWGQDYDAILASEIAQIPTDGKKRPIYGLIARTKAELRANLLTVEFTRRTIIMGPKEIPYTVRSSSDDNIVLEIDDGGKKKEIRLAMHGKDTMVTDLGMDGREFTLTRMYE